MGEGRKNPTAAEGMRRERRHFQTERKSYGELQPEKHPNLRSSAIAAFSISLSRFI
jgi:hypothetical protein